MSKNRRRHRLFALAAALLFVVPSGNALARTAHVNRVSLSMPRRIAQGDLVTISALTGRAETVCTLSLRYSNGEMQMGGVAASRHGRAKFKFRISRTATPGRATVTAQCGRAGVASRPTLVVGSVLAAKISVVKTGFSWRNYPFGSGVVSYGVILKNTSPSEDALSVYTLVNFVGPDNKLVGSATTTIQGIPANQQFALGGDLSFPGSVPQIARLEVVVQIQKRQAHSLRLPTINNLYIEPNVIEPNYVGAVDGEISNDEPRLILQNTQLSAVVFDAAGNILGGGTGFSFGSLPPAARVFFKIEGGFRAVPMSQAASAMVSAVGNYGAP